MLPEIEIQLEKQRVNNEIRAAFSAGLDELNWSSSDLSDANGKCASTCSEYVKKAGNYETDTLIENHYYIGRRITIISEPFVFKGYRPKKKEQKKQ